MNAVRIGHGYDVHAFSAGDGFVIGGVRIACDLAIVAHSDGDVLIHSLCDALLGALGEGDIGRHYPDSDPRNENRDSREFLRDVRQRVEAAGYRLGNAELLARDLECRPQQVNVKATTTEGLGFVGREQGIAVAAVVLLEAC